MSKVKILKSTNYKYTPLAEGAEVDVDDDTALRWAANGIAELLEDEEPREADPYEGMKVRALYDECVKRQLEVEERQKREYYLEALRKDDAEKAAASEE